MKVTELSTLSLLLSSGLVLIALAFSYHQKLRLEKEILIGAARAVVQLLIVGYILQYVFGTKSPWFTTLLVLIMIFNAARNAAKRGPEIKNGTEISYLAILSGAAATLSILVLSGAIRYEAQQVIPVSGMIIGNAMVALGLCYRRLTASFHDKAGEIETKLALGADPRLASLNLIRDAIRTGMQPTIDSAKTLGIVSLPGMMTGLILAGASPLEAVKFQIMVTFMLMATTAIASFIGCYLAYRGFFNDRKMLISNDH